MCVCVCVCVFDLLTYTVDNILKQAWALFSTQLNDFKYCYIKIKI